MARLLETEIYSEINAKLFELRMINMKKREYTIMIEELRVQHMQIVLQSLDETPYLNCVTAQSLSKTLTPSQVVWCF